MSLKEKTEAYNPNQYPEIVEIWEMHEEVHWTHREVRMQEDVNQWKGGNLSHEEMALISNILKLFTQSDVNVGEMYKERLIPFFQNDKVSDLFTSFAAREAIHKNAYAHLNNTLGFDEGSYHEFLDIKEMAEKHEYMISAIGDTDEDMAEYLAKQTLVEGVSLFASFVMLFNFDRMGKMKNMCNIVEWSMKDESLHVQGNALVFNLFLDENPEIDRDSLFSRVKATAEELVRLEDLFIDKAYEVGEVKGLGADEVKKYIRYVTDYRLHQLGIDPIFEVRENPIPWINEIMGGQSFTNFFEREVVDYSKNNLTGDFSPDVYGRYSF